MNSSIALISLRFRPAFVSHLAAFAKAYQAIGLEVKFLVCPEYLQFPDLKAVAPVVPYTGGEANKYTHALFVNVSQLNLPLARKLKNFGSKIIYVYHEPYAPGTSYLRAEGLRRVVMSRLAHKVSREMLKLANSVIVPSAFAASVYGRADIRYNPNIFCIPLLFDDEASPLCRDVTAKQYFSYIGTICRAHAFDEYIDFMRHCLACGLNVRFRIASAQALPRYVLRDGVIRRHLDRVDISCGHPIQNHQINTYYSESLCVWNIYRRSTQSGVLPKALMFGAPVLVSRTGSFAEFVEDGVEGRFVCAKNHSEIVLAVDDIRGRIAEYAANCRDRFSRTFFYQARLEDLVKVL